MEAETNVVSSEDQTENPGNFAMLANVSTDSTTSPACGASCSSDRARRFSWWLVLSVVGPDIPLMPVLSVVGQVIPLVVPVVPVVVPVQWVVPLKMVVLQRIWA